MGSTDRPGGAMYRILAIALAIGSVSVLETRTAFALDAGKALSSFRKCKACHQIGPDAENRVGPHLNGLEGRVAASQEGFEYSPAFRRAAERGLAWDIDSLDRFIEKPREFVKGTRMSYAGLRDADERANLVMWLLHFSPDGSELADAEETDGTPGAAALEIDGDVAYGEYLSGECVTCHAPSGRDSGIPAITGWPKESFIHALYEYKTDLRSNPVMRTVTARLGDEELAALAAYFGSLPAQ